MTYLLRISSSLLLLAPALWPADVTGTVELADSRDSIVRKKHNYSGVAVWLEPLNGAAAIKPGTFTISQRAKRFTPHITIVPTGSTVDFPNFDPIFHNAFSNFAGQPFDTGLYPKSPLPASRCGEGFLQYPLHHERSDRRRQLRPLRPERTFRRVPH